MSRGGFERKKMDLWIVGFGFGGPKVVRDEEEGDRGSVLIQWEAMRGFKERVRKG